MDEKAILTEIQNKIAAASREQLQRLASDFSLLEVGEYVAKKAAAEKEPDNVAVQLVRTSGYELLYDFQVIVEKDLGGDENG